LKNDKPYVQVAYGSIRRSSNSFFDKKIIVSTLKRLIYYFLGISKHSRILVTSDRIEFQVTESLVSNSNITDSITNEATTVTDTTLPVIETTTTLVETTETPISEITYLSDEKTTSLATTKVHETTKSISNTSKNYKAKISYLLGFACFLNFIFNG